MKNVTEGISKVTTLTPQEIRAEKVAILTAIQKKAKLETTVYNYQQNFNSNRNDTEFFGWAGEWMTLCAVGRVSAGIDLSKFKESDIVITKNNTVNIRLPKSEIFYYELDSKYTNVPTHTSNFFCSRDKDMETNMRKKAALVFRGYAIKDRILENADDNAAESIRGLVKKFGGKILKIKKINFVSN